MESNSQYLEDIDRNRVREIILSSESLNRNIQDRIIKKINQRFELEYSPRFFKINKISTNENRNTEYPGFSESIRTDIPITVIKGPNQTGKTTTFDKIRHIFLTPIPSRMKSSGWLTELELELQEINSNKDKYKIHFHSQDGLEGKKFEVFKEINGLYSELLNAEKFLEESLFIYYELNSLMFIPESSVNSIVNKYCTEEKNFQRLFRFPTVNFIFDTIEKEQEELNEKINHIHNALSGDQIELDRIKHFTRINTQFLEKDRFLIKNRKDLLEARKILDESKEILKEEGRKLNKEIRSHNIKVNKKQKELDDLNRILVPRATDRIELFRAQQVRQCWECGSIIPPDEFSKRVRKIPPLCYICGIGEVDYSVEMSTIPKEDLSELKNKQNRLKNEINYLEEEIGKLTKAYSELLPTPEKFTSKIWKKAMSFPEESTLLDEIKLATRRITKTEDELNNLEKTSKEINTLYQNKKGRRDELMKDHELLEQIKNEIENLEEEEYLNLKNEILNDVNQALMDLSYESAGRIFFDDEGYLNLETQLLAESEIEQRIVRKQKYTETDFSTGLLRKIDFAFVFSLIKAMVKRKKVPINAVFIDSFNHLSSDDQKIILEALANLPDFKTIIFSLEEPSNLSKEIYEVIPITRNSRVVKHEALNEINKHPTLDEFFT